jgi:hypothetical protein
LAFRNGNHGANAKFQLSQLFYDSDFICCIYAAETRVPEAATDYKLWPFAPIRGVSCNMHRASYYRDQADRARRLARAQIQDKTKALLRIVAQDYDNIAEDPENGAVEIFYPEMLPQP